jgi:hypothetical protein
MSAQQHFKATTVGVDGSYRRSPALAGDRAKAKTGKPNYGPTAACKPRSVGDPTMMRRAKFKIARWFAPTQKPR